MNAKKQSVKGGASSHLRLCKVGFADKHNLREDEHPSNKNIRPELSKNNSYWLDPEVPNLVALDRKIRKDYFEHNGRKLPTCGPTKASPLKETVTIMPSGDRSTDDIQALIIKRIEQRFGIHCIRRYNHRDEWCAETNTFNWHSHEIWDFYDYIHHRIIQLNRQDMREWQDIVAEETGMPRGNPVYETHRRWLTANEFKIQRQQEQIKANEEELERVGADVASEFTLKEGLEKYNEELTAKNARLKADNDKLEAEGKEEKALLEKARGLRESIKKDIQAIMDKHLAAGHILLDYNIYSEEKVVTSFSGVKSNHKEESYVLQIQQPDGRIIKRVIQQEDYYKSSDKMIKEIARFFFDLPKYKKKLASPQVVEKHLKNTLKL